MPAPLATLAKTAPPKLAGTEECWAAVDGHRVRYLRAGAGPPLVLLHGLLGYSFSWRFNFQALGSLATLYAPDLLGMGFSDRPAADYGLRASAERVLGFLATLGIEDFDLLGTSHGGAVAMRLAALAAERGAPRVQRVVPEHRPRRGGGLAVCDGGNDREARGREDSRAHHVSFHLFSPPW